MNEHHGSYDAGSVKGAIEGAVQSYEEGFATYWKPRLARLNTFVGTNANLFQRAESSAQAIIEATDDLTSVQKVRQALSMYLRDFEAPDLLDGAFVRRFISERFAISLGWEIGSIPEDGSERLWELLQLIEPISLNERSRTFLRRVSRCYIFGFNPECIALCGGCLDAEFDSQVPGDDFESLEHGQRLTLAKRIDLAEKQGRLSAKAAEMARRVNRDAKQLENVYARPDLPGRALDAIRSTLHVIRELAQEHQ